LRQDPVQAADRADLREKLRVAGGGVVFTTKGQSEMRQRGTDACGKAEAADRFE
jgi:type I restriction enzyme R subunit